MRIFCLENVRDCSVTTSFDCCGTYTLEIPVKHMTIIEVVEPFGHIK